MEKCAFTICAKNYIGLAKVLEESYRKYHKDSNFFIIIADLPDKDTPALSENIFVAKEILSFGEEEWNQLSFKYTLTEFCTAIKPYCFEWLFKEKNCQKAVYLDPDTYFFDSIEDTFRRLDTFPIIVVPHILTIQPRYTGDLWENLFLWAGIFNLGFLALHTGDESNKMLSWWGKVLLDECFIDNKRFTATDQKWITFLPMFFDTTQLYIDRNLGMDAAPWNFYEREFYKKENEMWVRNRIDQNQAPQRLKFVHYSNYNYGELGKGIVKHYTLKNDYPDLPLIFEPYMEHLKKSSLFTYLPLKYTYNTFENGYSISLLNRRIYRRLLIEGGTWNNPYAVCPGSFFHTLKKRGLLTKKRAVTHTVRGKGTRIHNKSKLVRMFDMLCLSLQKIMGIDRYEMFMQLAISRFAPENQTYLFDRKTRSNI